MLVNDGWRSQYSSLREFLIVRPSQITYWKYIPNDGRGSSKEQGFRQTSTFAKTGRNMKYKAEGSICGIPCSLLADTGANVILLRTDLARKLKEQLIYTSPNISLNTATDEKTEIHSKLNAKIECGSRKFQHEIYVPDIIDPCILGMDFLQKLNFTVDLEKNDIRTVEEEIPLFSSSVQHSKLCSVLAKERAIIPARSECLMQGAPKISGQFRYDINDFSSQVSQKGVLASDTLVDLKSKIIPV
ncbi:hypothetical protein AVEN_82352-1 [Araneus ventricosus]|uniref:Peptidase A2 domain-containing protein n=1 Tax=Araneus ventricosus TaxID=182803 RepID=A0A4Y2IVE2_ARAVE|nr:hypothetical protein AVEN_82352-1 [Araneus ventricosus]